MKKLREAMFKFGNVMRIDKVSLGQNKQVQSDEMLVMTASRAGS